MSMTYCFVCDFGYDSDEDMRHDACDLVTYAVKEGYLDEEVAENMDLEDREDYMEWSDHMANSQ